MKCSECFGTCYHVTTCSKRFDPHSLWYPAIEKYLEAIKADYRKWNGSDPNDVQLKMAAEFDAGLHIVETQLYYRVHSKTSCHSFVVKQDGPKFKRGDILKSAGYNTPAKNQARGNIFGTYRVRWTGAEYLR